MNRAQARQRSRSQLAQRITRQHDNARQHANQHLAPLADVGAPLPGEHPPPPMQMVMPITLVEVTADGVQVREAQPLYAGPRGATIPATGPGRWQQLYAAGRA